MKRILIGTLATLLLSTHTAWAQTQQMQGSAGSILKATAVAEFDQPWAMTFLPDKSLLVTTKPGKLFHVLTTGARHEITGVPQVAYAGQGGLGDVVAHPDFARNGLIYLSYVEADGQGLSGAVVKRGKLVLNTDGSGTLSDPQTVWTQSPKVSGRGHFSHRIAFGPKGGPHDGKIFITSGDRQKLDPAQDMALGLGKIIRLNEDGSLPGDNPWSDGSQGELAKTFWSTGHRNPLGIAFDRSGQLWANEMGPRHGDELNLIEKGANYGWPVVSDCPRSPLNSAAT